jgi:hypothetical protein
MMKSLSELPLLSWTPPEPPKFDGDTYDAERDGRRLNRQLMAVWMVVRDERWRTLAQIADETGEPEASISARLRDFRKPHIMGATVERRHVKQGLWEYRVIRGKVAAH